MKKISFLPLCLYTFCLFGSVEHKDEFIHFYLSNISSNLEEKTELIEHMLEKSSGTFLDIGTGGDASAFILQSLPKELSPTLIAADIDPLVIHSIQERRPDIKAFLHNTSGPNLKFMTMSATDMGDLNDSCLSGIGASAVAHEIVSYVPVKNALDQFLSEACRVLEKEGVLVYRDPKWVDDPESLCTMVVNDEIAKYYITLFLPKFLDRKFSLIKDYQGLCSKPILHHPDNIKINVHTRLDDRSVRLSFDEFLCMRTCDIDYDKKISIEAQKGLLAEIQRHYLMYLKNYYPVDMIDSSHFTGDLDLNSLQEESRRNILKLCSRKGLKLEKNLLKKDQMSDLFEELINLKKLILSENKLEISDAQAVLQYLNKFDLEPSKHNLFSFVNEKTMVIDPKLLCLLFQGNTAGFSQYIPIEASVFDCAIFEHLKLEGEEHYFYKTRDALITYFGQYSKYILKDGYKRDYMLAPIDKEHVQEQPRLHYQEILERAFTVTNRYGEKQLPVTQKNIIHFKLQPSDQAFKVYEHLLQAEIHEYPCLKKWLLDVER